MSACSYGIYFLLILSTIYLRLQVVACTLCERLCQDCSQRVWDPHLILCSLLVGLQVVAGAAGVRHLVVHVVRLVHAVQAGAASDQLRERQVDGAHVRARASRLRVVRLQVSAMLQFFESVAVEHYSNSMVVPMSKPAAAATKVERAQCRALVRRLQTSVEVCLPAAVCGAGIALNTMLCSVTVSLRRGTLMT